MPERVADYSLKPEDADLIVGCPEDIPAEALAANPDLAKPQRLGDFLQTDRGQKYGDIILSALKDRDELVSMGVDENKALMMTSRTFVKKDEEGNVLRIQAHEASPIEAAFEEKPEAEVEAPKPDPKGQSPAWNPNPAR